ncbi:MAG: methyltransferase domain-containing protein [Deltaproteobacteria bacterium]|nr:methyltransferase domain-containing protein [Deltaproteobacteria bacterium]
MTKRTYESVKGFYAAAAAKPKPELCCPIAYSADDISHIPQDAIEISYGCGSPVSLAVIKEGEVLLDLGSGGGIDCFIAAKYVGKNGGVIGIDMTDEMLNKAKKNSKTVAKNLGYDVVEFKKGFLESVPVPENTIDVVTSNCVVNLSPDKKKVFNEIYRILKDNGRFCISDIVSDKDVPLDMQVDNQLWGECISGALREDEFISIAKEAGFYGLEIIKRYLYKDTGSIKFYAITVSGYKFKKYPVRKEEEKVCGTACC